MIGSVNKQVEKTAGTAGSPIVCATTPEQMRVLCELQVSNPACDAGGE